MQGYVCLLRVCTSTSPRCGLLFNKLGNDSKGSSGLNETRSSLVGSLTGDMHVVRDSHSSFECLTK